VPKKNPVKLKESPSDDFVKILKAYSVPKDFHESLWAISHRIGFEQGVAAGFEAARVAQVDGTQLRMFEEVS
jgi:hypothetical protein